MVDPQHERSSYETHGLPWWGFQRLIRHVGTIPGAAFNLPLQ